MVQRQSGDWRFGCAWGRGSSLHHYQSWRVLHLRLATHLSYLEMESFCHSRFHTRKAVATKCDVLSWDDQLSLFELAFEKYGAVDIVVCILLPTVSPRCHLRADDDRFQTQESPKTHAVYVWET